MAYAATALEDGEMNRLFRVIDERSRHALYSIHADRTAAAARIATDYPQDLQEAALSALGPVMASSPQALFAERCAAPCRREFAQVVGAPMEEEPEGDELLVTTPQGQIRLYRAEEGDWWGMLWRLDALNRERDRAGQDLRRIEANAETYRRRRALQGP